MDGARYWRAVGLCAYGGGDVELSALQLYDGEVVDAAYPSVSCLLRGDGVSGSTTVTDSSQRPKTAAAYSGAVISTAQSKFGGASIFGANVSGARVVIASHEDFNMGAGDFTVECWAYVVSRNASSLEFFVARRIATGYWGFWLSIDQATGCPEFSVCNTALSQFKATSTTAFPLGQWVHLAGVRSGGQIKLFVDGAQAAVAAVSGTNFSTTEPVLLFGTTDGDYRFALNGYVDELRITKGVARYSSGFTPPTSAFPSSATGSVGARIDQDAVLTSPLVPVNGSIASLQDGSLENTVRLAAREPGFSLQWDFGVGIKKYVVGVAPGAATDSARFLSHLDMQYSSDGVSWTQGQVFGRYPWPGADTLAPPTSGTLPLLVRTSDASPNVAASSVVPQHSANSTSPLQQARDVEFGGTGRVRNTVKEKGAPDTPVRRRVRLVRERDGLVVREQWSDPATGAYDFQFVDERQTYTVLSYDHTLDFRAVIADGLTLANGTVELMP